MSRTWILVRQIVSVFCCIVGTTLAQGTTASILGSVYDQSRAVLPGVTVTATDPDTGQRREVMTDEQGRYLMAQMKIGRYVVETELPGFQKVSRSILLTLEGDAVVNFTLPVATSQTAVMVTSEAPLVETASSSVKGLVDEQQIRDLPLNGRSFTNLVTIQPGVLVNYNQSSTQIGNEGTKLNIAGTRSTQTSFQLDGTEIKNQMSTTPGSLAGVLLGVDTVQEFNVVTGVANAEYGAFTGGVVNAVSRSGTNSFHGNVFEFLRNSALDARNFFDRDPLNPLKRSSPSPFKRNQYGFTLGGPVKKDKLFFFGSFEGLNDKLATTQTGSVPSLQARQGIFAAGNVTPTAITKSILDTYPLPNGRVAGDVADFIFTNPQPTDERYYMSKIDWHPTDRDALAARYTLDDAKRHVLFNLDQVIDDAHTRSQYIMLEWKRILSSNLINEARVSLNRSFNGDNPVFLRTFPQVMQFNPQAFTYTGKPWYGQVAVAGAPIASSGFSLAFGKQNALNRFQYIDNLSFTKGAHSLKTGVNIQRLQLNFAAALFMPGQYTFRSIRDLVAGATPQSYTGTITGRIPRGMRETLLGFYIQDDWRMKSNLTVNMGLRYEPFTLPSEVAGRLSNYRHPSDTSMTVGNPMFTVNPSLKNFAPRVGFAWDPFKDGKTSIRAAYGLFYELIQPVHYFSTPTANAPYTIRILLDNPPFPDPTVGLPADRSKIITFPWSITDGIRQSGVHQFQVSVQQQILQDFVVQASYTGSRGYNLGHIVDRNTAIPQKDAAGVYPFWPVGSVRRNSSFSFMQDFSWDASSYYNALGILVKRRFGRGYGFQVAYTYGKSIDDASSTTVFDGGSAPNGATFFPDNVKADRGLSTFDVRNRLVINGSVDLPFGRGHGVGGDWSGPLQQILGGWTLNGIVTAADGGHANLLIPFNRSNSQQTFDIPDRPNVIAGGNTNPVRANGRDPNLYYDPLQFEVGPAGYLGNLGRDTIETAGVLSGDVSVTKNFNFTEQRYVQFRAELFNFANRANFGSAVTSVFVNPTTRNPNAGRITRTTTTSRQIQFALKIYF